MLFFCLLLFIVITYIQPQDFIPIVKGLPIVYFLLMFLGILWSFRLLTKGDLKLGKAPQNILMFLFWIAITLSTLKVAWFPYTLEIFLEWSKVIIIYCFVVTIVNSEEKLIATNWAIVLSILITAWLGILQNFGLDFTGLGTHLAGRIRGVGIFGTNQLAYAMCFTLPLVFYLFRITPKILPRILLILTAISLGYCTFLTQSRGGLLCFSIVILLTFISFTKKKRIKLLGIVLSIAIFILLIKFAPRFSSTFEYQEDASAVNRLNAWADGLSMAKENPLFGIGKNQFVETFKIAAHNSFIETLTEVGFVGLFIWLGLFSLTLRNLRAIFKNDTNNSTAMRIYSKYLSISFYAYLIGSYFSASSYYIPLYILFALSVILQNLLYREELSYIRWKDLGNIAFIEIGVLIFIHLVARFS